MKSISKTTSAVPKSKDRAETLKDLRDLKMARSAHAYVRGNTAQFYAWLSSHEDAIPDGPPVWICGDCHIGNLGPIANAKGNVVVEIRDLDQTVIGNPAHDLIRLGLSLASAARGSDLPGVLTSRMLEDMIDGYEQAFGDDADREMPETIRTAVMVAMNRKWSELAKERMGGRLSIPLGKKYWPLTKLERKAVEALFQTEKLRRMVTSLRDRDADARLEVVDAAYWVKGCSSLGNLRLAVLVAIDGDELCLMDVKEAIAPLAPHYRGADMPVDNGERVATGAWHLSPSLGDRIVAAPLLDRSVFVRELMPQDLKFQIEHLTAEEACAVAHFLAGVVGKAHARQMDSPTKAKWLRTLQSRRPRDFDGPTWLWVSVVDLLMLHEGAYLGHCRQYSRQQAGLSTDR
ncbi:DUF2252 family protein [Asticcacaulis sp. YBE204]|uniref:DUF2252 family protein n=1 Tax=Asticcacaulis sp. YBE204 TaxID=1282363 RepID=UPI0003C3B117|nr:DUF2252 family protein [Asticcacaulis sp. YBE204]ESQ79418.1 hypothetical protein AEYBE204_10450 [Asticcacaulis sp. YBE204]